MKKRPKIKKFFIKSPLEMTIERINKIAHDDKVNYKNPKK
jgi:hypothetical protein